MSGPLLAVVAVIYAYVAFEFWQKGKSGMCLAFTAYAVSCIGFIIAAMRNE